MRIFLRSPFILIVPLYIAWFLIGLTGLSGQLAPAEVPVELESDGDVRSIEVFGRRGNGSERRVPVATAEFDKNGRMVSRDSYSDGEFQWTSRFEYDDSGRLVNWISKDEDGSTQWEYRYVYDSYGFLEREVSFDSSGEIDGMHTYEYDSGRLLEEAVYGGGGSLQWSREILYNDDLTEREWRLIYPDGGVVKSSSEFLDRFGRVVREVNYGGAEQAAEIVRHDYGASGENVRTRVESSNGELVRSTERSFNEHGDLEREIRIEVNTDTRIEREFDYSYDDRGNWLERLENERALRSGVQSRQEQELLERSIVYYD